MSPIGCVIAALTGWQFLTLVVLWTVFLSVEALAPRFRYDRTKEPLWRRIRRNITVGCVYRLLVLPIAITPVLLAASHISFWHRPVWMRGIEFMIIDFVIFDFLNYALHWAFHRSKYLWRYHMVHHLDQHLDATSAGRTHFVEKALEGLVRGAAVLIFAVPLHTVIIWQTFSFFIGLYQHTNVGIGRRLDRWISVVFCTPTFHDIHHGRDIKHTDSNYAFALTIWDYLFRTYSTMTRPEHFANGLDDHGDYSATALLLNPMFRRGKPFREVESQALAQGPALAPAPVAPSPQRPGRGWVVGLRSGPAYLTGLRLPARRVVGRAGARHLPTPSCTVAGGFRKLTDFAATPAL
jgi:sterol desaturase/sphingolipid hydroxylase (fatty acid hydroxylase superfamily)